MTSAFLEFGETHLLGIAAIDAEHRELAESLNGVAALALTDGDELLMRLAALYGHARTHFAHEESMMEAFGYPELAGHRREHTMLLAELKTLIKGIESGHEELDQLTLKALKGWLIAHIVGSDRAFANAFLHSG